MIKGYILFFTTSSAFRCEKIFKNKTVTTTFKLVPTPREFSSDCGIAIYFECEDCEVLCSAISDIECEIKRL